MVDIHSHILWGLDDGAETLEQGVAMVRLAESHGTTDLVATPHASPDYRFQPELVQTRALRLSEAAGCKIRIHTGCDFHLEFHNIQDALANPQKYTINQKNYLLVEFPELIVERAISEILGRLLGAGMIPVITHPERNRYLQRHMDAIGPWLEDGCLVQVTGQSLLGDFGRTARQAAEDLLARQFVHFIASDGHNTEQRPPSLVRTYQALAAQCGEETARQLCVINPARVLTGEPWPLQSSPTHKRKRRIFFLA